MTTTFKEARSGIDMANLQEVLDAESSAGHALLKGQQQYTTPDWLVADCNSVLRRKLGYVTPATVIDPQVGQGALLKFGGYGTRRFGCDIDNRLDGIEGVDVITGNCVKLFELIAELFPNLKFVCVNANPPFGKKLKQADGSLIDSTEVTWNWAISHGTYGYFIANASTIERMGWNKHPAVYEYQVHPGNKIWTNVRDELKIGIIFWKHPPGAVNATPPHEVIQAWSQLKAIMDEERHSRPPFNIYLDKKGFLKTYLSVRHKLKRRLSNEQIQRLHRINDCHPLTLTTERETRDLMGELIQCGFYEIEPAAKTAIEQALLEVNRCACPVMPVTAFESVAYADEEDTLECKVTCETGGMRFTAGRKYKLDTGVYRFTDKFKRNKVHFNEQTGVTYTREHECQLSGQDRYIQITDDNNRAHMFMDRPRHDDEHQHPEAMLWEIFKQPEVKTVADTMADVIERNLAVLRSCEILAGYKYYPGQLGYLARVGVKDHGLIAAGTGAGKSLFALSLIAMKAPERCLIIAPQGTMRSSEADVDDDEEQEECNASQWLVEIANFTPYLQVFELFSESDYQRICSLNNGTLPPGVYVTYYEAFGLNGARESCPENWNDEKLNSVVKGMGLPPLPLVEGEPRAWCDTVGKEIDGVRCIVAPSLATSIGHLFDCVMLDEVHKIKNLDGVMGKALLRMQPRYRYGFSATPIPNTVSDIFSIMGWLNVPEWYKGGRRNAAWPYSREELSRFNTTFLSQERDFTQEEMNRERDPEWRGICAKNSPVISAPARLLKLLKPSMSYIGKEECNPDYKSPKIIDVRVPLGKAQAALYGHYLQRHNVPGRHPLIRARRQTAWLRAICADPAGFRHGGPRVTSNMNPKVLAILQLTAQVLAEGEQVVIINSRIGITNTIQDKLAEAGVPMARIDSTVTAEQHSYQANLFKSGKARVMLMGIKCAAAHSFSQCTREIIGSIEYSYGPFGQACGRIDRVNSRPGVTIYCILHKMSIEEVMYEVMSLKGDSSDLCLRGRRIPRDYKPVDGSEILATAIDRFDLTGATPETECAAAWPILRKAIQKGLTPSA